MWPAAPFLEHLAASSPDTARAWLAGHVEQIAAAGPAALDALLRLALARALGPGQVRLLLPHITAPARTDAPAGWTRRLAARWARTWPAAERDGAWLLVTERLLKDAVDADHAGHPALQAVAERAYAAQERAAASPDATAAPGPAAQALADEELETAAARDVAGRLPDHEAAGLLRELVRTAHPAGGAPFGWLAPLRQALAGLVRRDVEATAEAARHVVFDTDLDEVSLRHPAQSAFLGPLLAAAEAAAGVALAERTGAWPRVAAVEPRLHDRLLASHLAAHPPAGGTDSHELDRWWDEATGLTVRLLAARPTPEGARLAALVPDSCPPARSGGLHRRARVALGPAPSADAIDHVLATGRADGTTEPLASWLRAWDWSPVLPPELLAGVAPLMAALLRHKPAGPADPRSAPDLAPLRHTVTLEEEDLAELAAAAGPPAAAAALADAPDAGADGYVSVLQRLVEADPAAWTADVPQILEAVARPELRAFYLAAAALAARRPGAFPAGPVSAALAALTLRRTLPAGQPRSSTALFVDQAAFGLLCGAPAPTLPTTCRPSWTTCTRSPSPSPAPPPAATGPAAQPSRPVTCWDRPRRCGRWAASSRMPPPRPAWAPPCLTTSCT
ncbi:hypothetical protein AB0N77_22025 [Streptomyces misionensis]|uniref:hypothetical protein n=1 Tax=Streptomyces misionensis TaxID=67331 RepID=UPI0034405C0D